MNARWLTGVGLAGALGLAAGCRTLNLSGPDLTAGQAAERGLAAARGGKWDKAVAALRDAQERSHLDPVLFYNLGLAHAKAGHEIEACAWLQAYLTALPDAPNAPQVRAQVAKLDQAAGRKVSALLGQADALAEQLPLKGPEADGEGRRATAYDALADYHFRSGDVPGGLACLDRAQRCSQRGTPSYRRDRGANARWLFSMTQAAANDLVGLMDSYEAVTNDSEHKAMVGDIVSAHIRLGMLEEAERLIETRRWGAECPEWLLDRMACAWLEKDDLGKAECWARRAAAKGDDSQYHLRDVMRACLYMGDVNRAVSLAREAGKDGECRAVAGHAGEAIRDLTGGERSVFGVNWPEEVLCRITADLLLLGDREYARRAAEAVRVPGYTPEFLKFPRRDVKPRAINIALADGYLLIGEGRAKEAVRGIDRAVRRELAERIYGGGDRHRLVRASSDRQVLYDRLASLAIALNDLRAAEEVVDAHPSSRQRILWLRRMIAACDRRGDAAGAARLRQKLQGVESAARNGWEGDAGRVAAVEAWLDAIRELEADGRLTDLSWNVLEAGKKPEEAPGQLAGLAWELEEGLLRVRAQAARSGNGPR